MSTTQEYSRNIEATAIKNQKSENSYKQKCHVKTVVIKVSRPTFYRIQIEYRQILQNIDRFYRIYNLFRSGKIKIDFQPSR